MELNSFKRELLVKEFPFLKGEQTTVACPNCEQINHFFGVPFLTYLKCFSCQSELKSPGSNWPSFLKADTLTIKKADSRLFESVGDVETWSSSVSSSEKGTQYWIVLQDELVVSVPETREDRCAGHDPDSFSKGQSIAEFCYTEGIEPKYIIEQSFNYCSYDDMEDWEDVILYKVKDESCKESIKRGFKKAYQAIIDEIEKAE
jgi:ribosomal protein S27E